MKRIYHVVFIFLAFLSSGGLLSGQELTILHTNDMHSKLTGFGPESEYSPLVTGNDSTSGGFARLSALFKQVREESPDRTLILDAGDFLMGSLFHVAEEETGFQLNLMKQIGYDYITLGNHEFEFGPGNLAKVLKSAGEKGGYPQVVASNMIFSKESGEDDELEQLFQNKSIQPYSIIQKNGIKIGIFGLVGIDAARVAPASQPVSFSDPEKVAAKMAAFLKTEKKVNLVILLSHGGIYPHLQNNGYAGEDIDLAERVPLVDIIISGHTHVKTPRFIKAGNTYIVQAGSNASHVGEIKLRYRDGKIAEFKFNLLAIDDKIQGDSAVFNKIEKCIDYIDKEYLASAGLTYRQTVGKLNFDIKCDYTDLKSSNLGPFVADASKYYLESTGNHADFSLVASGTIREDMLKGIKGLISVADVFRVMSLGKGYDVVPGYPLAKIHLTAHEVKKLMEILIISRGKGGDGFIYFSGIKIYIDSGKGFLRKVQKVEINGKEIDYSKKKTTLYSVTANTYLLSFIGEIKKMSHGLVKVVPKDKYGRPVTDMKNQLIDVNQQKEGIQEAKEWIALIEYMKSFERNGENIPVVPDYYNAGDRTVVDMAK